MKYYPICLDIKNKNCLVVGGGKVGSRKVKTLLDCGAMVTVVSPETTAELDLLENQDKIIVNRRPYQASDLENAFLVIGASCDEKINRAVSRDSENIGILCNIADVPDLCNFILPAIVSRGDLVLSISTSGKSPALAKKIRKDLEMEFGEEYSQFLILMGQIRERLLQEEHAPEAHKHIFEKLVSGELLKMVKNGKIEEARVILLKTLGNDFQDLLHKTLNNRNI